MLESPVSTHWRLLVLNDMTMCASIPDDWFLFVATDEGQVYYPMFFTNDKPFEEFYCIAIQLLNKTWKEMKATAEDFTKVLYRYYLAFVFWDLY